MSATIQQLQTRANEAVRSFATGGSFSAEVPFASVSPLVSRQEPAGGLIQLAIARAH